MPGVAEVASFGGYVRQVQIVVDPNRLAAYGVPIGEVVAAVQASNNESGGRLIEWSGAEYMVRIRGYARTVEEFGAVVLRASPTGVPLRVRDVATVELGPESRRGTGDLDGQGDAVGGIVVMRHGENALNVIRRVQAKLDDLAASLPPGVEVVTTYDRSNLILRALDTLKHELVLEMIVVSLVILFFLWHFPSAIVPIVTIPISVLLSFIPLYLLGISVNIMTLAGIAISIGVLVDGAIVEVENAYNKLHLWELGGRKGDFHAVRLAALQEVGPSVFFSLLVIAVAFLPIFALVDQEGRLFGPLAWSKNLAMLLAALLAITLDPALRMLFARMDPFTFKPRFLARLASGTPRRDLPRRGAPSGEPRHPPRLRAGLPLRAEVAEGGHRRGARDPRPVAAALFPARLRVHAAARRGLDPLHADDAPRHLDRRGAAGARAPGPDPRRLPRGRARPRQGGAGRERDRPGAALDVRDHGGAETRDRSGGPRRPGTRTGCPTS